MSWKQGPLPPDTYNWGGVVPAGDDTGGGFYFADFKGDHVVAIGAAKKGEGPDGGDDRILQPNEVAWFNNDLVLPPGSTGVHKRANTGG